VSHPGPGTARRDRALGLVIALVVVFCVVMGVSQIRTRTIAGHAVPAGGAATVLPPPKPARQPGWTTLSNPAAGLSYQIPTTGWATKQQVGTAASIALTQGADLTAYVCGNPAEQLLRGTLGSGTSPPVPPGSLATSVALAAASQFYLAGTAPPKITMDPPQAVRYPAKGGRQLPGVYVRAIATQNADRCLAARGEVLVLVLQFPDHDAVLVVNGDLAGGPAKPPPTTEDALRKIIGTATAIG
jgi:hypothetical protein